MATGTIYIKTRNDTRPRCIKTSDNSALTVIWGQKSSGLVRYTDSGTATTTHLKTFLDIQERDASTGTGVNTVQTSELTLVDLTGVVTISIDVFQYLKFTGVGLPTGGIIIPQDEIIDIFTELPTDL